MKYKKLIFDLDGTLVSDRESMKYAFCCVLKELGIAPSMDLALEWLKFDDAYWHEIESGRTVFPEYVQTKEDRRVYAQAMRFVLFFESCPRRNAFKSFWWNSAQHQSNNN